MYETKQGDKICYTCKGYPRCPKRMQLTLDPESSDVHVHVSTDAHDHHLIATTKGLNPSSKAKVLELLSVGVTQPRKILKELEKNNLPPLTKPQLNNLKQRTQKKVGGPQICSLSDFLLWVKKREKVPDDEDEVYVVAYEHKLSKHNTNKIKDLRCFMSTKRLIRQAINSNIFLLL